MPALDDHEQPSTACERAQPLKHCVDRPAIGRGAGELVDPERHQWSGGAVQDYRVGIAGVMAYLASSLLLATSATVGALEGELMAVLLAADRASPAVAGGTGGAVRRGASRLQRLSVGSPRLQVVHTADEAIGVNRVVPDAAPALTERFLAAVALAEQIHGRHRRIGTEVPYLAHLLVVCGLVLEDGGDEDEAIAAMLHDSVEDGGGRPVLDRIQRSFGPRVAAIVEGCTDNLDGDPDEPWIERKQRYLKHLPEVTDNAVLRVALADKVHNARSLVRDYREEGPRLWERFANKTPREQLWYYDGLVDFFGNHRPGPLAEDLRRAVDELATLVGHDEAQHATDE